MKAWQVDHFGKPDEMLLADVPVPEPAQKEVRIRNSAAALNFFDILLVQGLYQDRPPFPFTPGAEVAGTVDAVGAGVSTFSVDDKVLAMPQRGGYAEFSVADADRTFRVPDGLSFAEAAAFPIVYQTSYCALVPRAALKAGEWLLVHAGASGVGMAAIQLGKAFGARVIATAGSQPKLDFCIDQGADNAISYCDEDWVERVKELTGGRGVDVIYDPVGGDVFDLSTKCIAPQGRLLVVGFTSGRIPGIKANRILLKSMSVVGVYWGRYASEHPGYLQEAHEALSSFVADGKIKPTIGREYRLDEAPAALQDLMDRKLMGKAVLVVD